MGSGSAKPVRAWPQRGEGQRRQGQSQAGDRAREWQAVLAREPRARQLFGAACAADRLLVPAVSDVEVAPGG